MTMLEHAAGVTKQETGPSKDSICEGGCEVIEVHQHL